MKDLLFDLDGTITDPALGITNSVQYALKEYGIQEEYQNLLKFIGPPLIDSFKEFYGFSQEKAEAAVRKYREYFSEKGLFENKVYPGMEEFLQQLKKDGYCLSIATSKPEKFAKEIIEHFALDLYFDFIFGASMDSTRSKKGDIIAYALKELEITNKDEVIMIGDRMHDIIGAHENGLKAIGVLYGYGDCQEMKEYQADGIAVDLKDLYSKIKQFK